jgi:hypothetical protein
MLPFSPSEGSGAAKERTDRVVKGILRLTTSHHLDIQFSICTYPSNKDHFASVSTKFVFNRIDF